MATFDIDPVNRIEGHQKWAVTVANDSPSGGWVTHAAIEGRMFRGFERILEGRDPRDPIIICGRI